MTSLAKEMSGLEGFKYHPWLGSLLQLSLVGVNNMRRIMIVISSYEVTDIPSNSWYAVSNSGGEA